MPELQTTPPATAQTLPLVNPDDCDYAFGCECADPSLQIERWGIDEPEAGEAN